MTSIKNKLLHKTNYFTDYLQIFPFKDFQGENVWWLLLLLEDFYETSKRSALIEQALVVRGTTCF